MGSGAAEPVRSPRPAAPLVFSDLDGTLLDAESYSWEAARPALGELRSAGGLLIPATSKTAAEVEALERDLRRVVDVGPVVVENGAAVQGPDGAPAPEGARGRGGGGWELVLGPDRDEVMEELALLRRRSGLEIVGLTEMSESRARDETGLEGEALAAARNRRHTEPFLAPGGDLDGLRSALGDRGLEITRGGRFFHLGGATGKGDAARRVLAAYRADGATGPTVGLGDSLNDRGLLEMVDRPVLIPHPDGRYDDDLVDLRPDLVLAPRPGPSGWDAAMRPILAEIAGR